MKVGRTHRAAHHASCGGREDGFTLAELVVAAGVTAAVMAAALTLLGRARSGADRDGAALDVAQRARAGFDALVRTVWNAGAGPPDVTLGHLAHAVPVIGAGDADIGAFHALRVLTTPPDAAYGRLADAVGGGTRLVLAPSPACAARPACGFTPGTTALVYDGSGAFDMVVVTAIDTAACAVVVEPALSRAYPAGTHVVAADGVTFRLVPQPDGSAELVQATVGGAVQPLVDNVVSFEVRLMGRRLPPETGFAPDMAPTYGPIPPPAGKDDERDAWGSGENCTTARAGGRPVSRLAVWDGETPLVEMPAGALDDGPWCPGTDGGVYDADHFRIRRIDILLRVEAASARLRGPAGALFARGGRGVPATWVPDVALAMAVSPPNLEAR